MAADDLVMQGARASGAIVLARLVLLEYSGFSREALNLILKGSYDSVLLGQSHGCFLCRQVINALDINFLR